MYLARAACLVFPALLMAACGDGAERAGQAAPASDRASCAGLPASEMVWVEGGTFAFGDEARLPEEGPARQTTVEGFWISSTEVTNAQFAEFVAQTGYVTEAERPPPVLPGAPPEMQQPGSAVFRVPTQDNPNWWVWVNGAQWRHPDGPESGIEGRGNHPVVQVSYSDALAYAEWAGVSLPTEEQWEYAARGGQPSRSEPRDDDGIVQANYYQGVFPRKDTGEDGFISRAPVGCFEANAFGLHDMIGNVWEWTASGPDTGRKVNIIKGGSYLCASNYCARYRPAARQFQERDLATDHIGFRVVDNERPAPAP